MNILFESNRIAFVSVDEAYLEDYLAMVNDPKITRYLTGMLPYYSEEKERAWIRENQNNPYLLTMIDKQSHRFIGNIELIKPKDAQGELGIALAKEMQDQHYGSEGLKRFIDYCFLDLQIKRITLHVYAFNTRAIHVYEKQGFTVYKQDGQDIYMELKNA